MNRAELRRLAKVKQRRWLRSPVRFWYTGRRGHGKVSEAELRGAMVKAFESTGRAGQ